MDEVLKKKKALENQIIQALEEKRSILDEHPSAGRVVILDYFAACDKLDKLLEAHEQLTKGE